jgi:hypothetical protein
VHLLHVPQDAAAGSLVDDLLPPLDLLSDAGPAAEQRLGQGVVSSQLAQIVPDVVLASRGAVVGAVESLRDDLIARGEILQERARVRGGKGGCLTDLTMILLVGSMDMTLLTGGKKGTNPPRELFSGRAVLFLATARTVLEFSVGFSKSLFLVYCTIVADSLWKWTQGEI